jgi:uncharacterized protein (DUF849 family)
MDLIVNFTPTGMVPTRKMTPYVPITVDEIVEEVHEALEIGITIVHLHARDKHTEIPTYKAEVYGKIISGIRSFSKDLIVCVSLSGRNFKEFEKRAEPLQLDGDMKPDMGSLTLSSLNFITEASMNSPDMVQALATEMRSRDILPELEAFDLGMINYAKYLERKGILQQPHYFNLLLGNIAGAQADLAHAGLMIKELPDNSVWSLAGIGTTQYMMNTIAIVSGGGVRVGLEDNIYYDSRRKVLATNMELLRRISRFAEESERKIMSPSECRRLLNLQEGDGKYGRIYNGSQKTSKVAMTA